MENKTNNEHTLELLNEVENWLNTHFLLIMKMKNEDYTFKYKCVVEPPTSENNFYSFHLEHKEDESCRFILNFMVDQNPANTISKIIGFQAQILREEIEKIDKTEVN